MLRYTANEGWREGCGCSGKPLKSVVLPEDSTHVVFTVRVNQYLTVNGNRYHARPGLIAVDVRQGDVTALGDRVRNVSSADLSKLTGYRSRA